MPYERTPHVQGTKRLQSTDGSRYSQVSLTITRGRGEKGTWSLVARQVGGGYITDRRLLWGTLDLPHGSRESLDPEYAIWKALNIGFPGVTEEVPES